MLRMLLHVKEDLCPVILENDDWRTAKDIECQLNTGWLIDWSDECIGIFEETPYAPALFGEETIGRGRC